MSVYANLHVALEQMRVRALREIRGSPVPPQDKEKSEPPRVLILGPDHSGKTTICKILTNYAVRAGQGWSPFLINVDPSEVSLWVIEIDNCNRASLCSGRLGCARGIIRRTSIRTYPHGITSESTWNSRDDCTDVTSC